MPRLSSQSWYCWGTGEKPFPRAVTTLAGGSAASPASASAGDPHVSHCWTPSCCSIWEHSRPLSLSRHAARKGQKSLHTVICYLPIHVPEPASSEKLSFRSNFPSKQRGFTTLLPSTCFVIASHCWWILWFIPYQAVHHSSVLCFSKGFGRHMVWRLPRTVAQCNTAWKFPSNRQEEEEEWLPRVRTNTAMAMTKLLAFISSANTYSKIQMFFSFSLCGPI